MVHNISCLDSVTALTPLPLSAPVGFTVMNKKRLMEHGIREDHGTHDDVGMIAVNGMAGFGSAARGPPLLSKPPFDRPLLPPRPPPGGYKFATGYVPEQTNSELRPLDGRGYCPVAFFSGNTANLTDGLSGGGASGAGVWSLEPAIPQTAQLPGTSTRRLAVAGAFNSSRQL